MAVTQIMNAANSFSMNFQEEFEKTILSLLCFLQFMKNSTFLAIRVVSTLYVLVVIVLSGVNQRDVRWFIFLTNWSFTLLCLSQLCNVFLSARDVFLEQSAKEGSSVDRAEWAWFHSIHRVLYTTAATAAIAVTILYWSLLTPVVNFVSVSAHALNTVIAVGDLLLSNTPIAILHVVYPVIYALVWIIFTLIYTFSDGTNPDDGGNYVYTVLDWRSETSTAVIITVVTIVVGAPLLHFATYVLYRIRAWTATKLASHSSDNNDGIPMDAMV